MEYVYAAMLLHKVGKEINEDSIKKVLDAAGVEINNAKIKALVAALEGVNIEEAIQKQAVAVAQVTSAPTENNAPVEEKKEEKKEDKKAEAAGAAGLGALFG